MFWVFPVSEVGFWSLELEPAAIICQHWRLLDGTCGHCVGHTQMPTSRWGLGAGSAGAGGEKGIFSVSLPVLGTPGVLPSNYSFLFST